MSQTRLGGKVRALRRREGLSQAKFAQRIGISPSYLNLIEHDRRPLTAALLLKIAQRFAVDLQAFAAESDASAISALTELFADPLFERFDIVTTELQELVLGAPTAARAILHLWHTYRGVHQSAELLSSQLTEDLALPGVERIRLPSVEVTDLIEREMNHFPELEAAAEAIWERAGLRADDLWHGMVRYLRETHGVEVQVVKATLDRGLMRSFDPSRKRLYLSDALPQSSQNFQTAYQIGLLLRPGAIERLAADPRLTTDESRSLGQVAALNYFAGAVLMPYQPFSAAAREERYDIELLQNRFGTSFEQVCHRLTSLQRPGDEGIPFHFARTDIAGNLSKWFNTAALQVPRFGGSCPRWSLHTAFLTPGQIIVQLSRRVDGQVHFSIARTVSSAARGYHLPRAMQAITLGCEVRHATAMVYADGVDLQAPDAPVAVGTTCRLCDLIDCDQRVFSPVHHPQRIDLSARGISFFTPVSSVAGSAAGDDE